MNKIIHPKHHNSSTGAIKYVPLALIAAFLMLALWLVLSLRTVEAPSRSTTDTRPNSQQNVPDSQNRSVTEDGNPAEDTTPSSSGAGGNTLLRE